jgi:3-hydroxymyristoyl/3-hydroxydecanoyl-(acyl carrier protein) dehydratase
MIYNENDLATMFLPIGNMLQVHQIVEIKDGIILGERRISKEDWFFPIHFPQDPIFPGSLMIEGAGQIVAVWGWHQGLRGKPRLVKTSAEFKSPVSSKDGVLSYHGKVKKKQNICIGTVELKVGTRSIGEISACIAVVPA